MQKLKIAFLDVNISVISWIWKDTNINSQNVYKRKINRSGFELKITKINMKYFVQFLSSNFVST